MNSEVVMNSEVGVTICPTEHPLNIQWIQSTPVMTGSLTDLDKENIKMASKEQLSEEAKNKLAALHDYIVMQYLAKALLDRSGKATVNVKITLPAIEMNKAFITEVGSVSTSSASTTFDIDARFETLAKENREVVNVVTLRHTEDINSINAKLDQLLKGKSAAARGRFIPDLGRNTWGSTNECVGKPSST